MEARKQKVATLVLAAEASTMASPAASVSARYRPVVTWRRRKGCPQRRWLPLQLGTGTVVSPGAGTWGGDMGTQGWDMGT